MGVFPSKIATPLPGREFPGRNSAPRYLPDWFDVKKKDDQQRLGFSSSYWCIADKCYDLSSFYDKHPGGRTWLETTRGLDCTAIFESHHPSMNSNPILKSLNKFYVCDVKNKNKNDKYHYNTFSFDNKISHYTKVRDLIYKTLNSNKNTNQNDRKWNLPSIKMHIYCIIVFILFLSSFVNLCFYNQSLISAIICGILLNPLIGISHNFMHQADNKGLLNIETYWRYIINFSLMTVEDWKIHHVISHHQDINLNSDVEAYGFEPFVYYMTNQPTNSIFVYLYVPFFYFLFSSVFHFPGLLTKYKRKHLKWNYLIPTGELIILCIINYNIIGYMIWYWIVMHGTMFCCLMIVSTPIHRSDYQWSEGDSNGTKDFLEHCLLTTHDYYSEWGLFAGLFFFDTFNEHRLHHLFPTLDASKIRTIKPIFVEYCKKNGLQKYFQKKYGLIELFGGLLRNMHRKKPPIKIQNATRNK